jgi:hypothetical protein
MIDFLLGVPGKLSTIIGWFTNYWTAARAAKLDYLTGNVALSSTAVSNSDYTPARAAALDNIAALGTNPILSPPIANGLTLPNNVLSSNVTYNTLTAACAGQYATSTSTSYVAVVSVTGKGVLNFLALMSGNTNAIYNLRLTIDGVVIFTLSVSGNYIYVGAAQCQSVSPYDVYGVTYDNIPFKQSLLIEHLTNNSSYQVVTVYKYHRTA